jgi:tetratricopeptide (TPR) repeat protein
MAKAKTIALNVAVTAFIAIILIWGTTWYRQMSQFSRGEAAFAAGDSTAAIAGYEAALHMYTPASPLNERAATRLLALGEALERRGDLDRALIAYRSLRSSWYAVCWLTQPGEEWIARCDRKITELVQVQAQIDQHKR